MDGEIGWQHYAFDLAIADNITSVIRSYSLAAAVDVTEAM